MDDNFKKVLEQILADKARKSQESSDQSLFEEKNREEDVTDPEYKIRNTLYSSLLMSYITAFQKKTNANHILKWIFFIVTMLVFLVIICASCSIMIITALKPEIVVGDIVNVLSAIAGVLSVVIVLPKTIAEYLFLKSEDANILQMVKDMQQNDAGIRSFERENKHKNKKEG